MPCGWVLFAAVAAVDVTSLKQSGQSMLMVDHDAGNSVGTMRDEGIRTAMKEADGSSSSGGSTSYVYLNNSHCNRDHTQTWSTVPGMTANGMTSAGLEDCQSKCDAHSACQFMSYWETSRWCRLSSICDATFDPSLHPAYEPTAIYRKQTGGGPYAQQVGGARFTDGGGRRWDGDPGYRYFYGRVDASTCEATCLQDSECWGFGTSSTYCYVWTTSSTNLVSTAGFEGLCTESATMDFGSPRPAGTQTCGGRELKPGSTSSNGFAQLGTPTGSGDLDNYYLICGEDRGVATNLEGYCGS